MDIDDAAGFIQLSPDTRAVLDGGRTVLLFHRKLLLPFRVYFERHLVFADDDRDSVSSPGQRVAMTLGIFPGTSADCLFSDLTRHVAWEALVRCGMVGVNGVDVGKCR